MNMVIQIASIVLRVCGVLALLLGLLFWNGNALNFIPVHTLLGILLVGSLWITGIGQALARGGSWQLAAAALVVGVLAIAVGIRQSALLVGSFHWVIQIIHLLLGVLAIGIGQISAARYRKRASGVASQASA
jgi:hypothetical protein